jgi:hypothetical protein
MTEPEKKKNTFVAWMKDYIINDVSPAENWFDHICKRRPHLKRYQWYISLCIDIAFFIFLIYAMKWGADKCLVSGLEQLSQSCDVCLKQCVNISATHTEITLVIPK